MANTVLGVALTCVNFYAIRFEKVGKIIVKFSHLNRWRLLLACLVYFRAKIIQNT